MGLFDFLRRDRQTAAKSRISLDTDVPELSRYQLHETNYVMEHFRHLMTESERVAAEAMLFFVEEDGERKLQIAFEKKPKRKIAADASELLQQGPLAFRRSTTERILSEHRDEVYARACPQCGLLLATPKAKLCLWCSHSWFDEPEK